MGKKTGWENSTKSPDWMDVAAMMGAIGTLHGGQVGFTVQPRGTGFTIGVSVAASIMFDVPLQTEEEGMVTVVKDWPCSSHAELSAHVFSLLYELDYKISAVYKQKTVFN